MKRIFPIFLCLCVCLSVFAFSVSAEEVDGWNILRADDFVSHYIFDEGNGGGFAAFKIPDEYCAVQTVDMYGSRYLPNGVFNGSITSNTGDGSWFGFGLYSPGGYINKTLLDVSTIHTGAVLEVEYDEYYFKATNQDYVKVTPSFNIRYFDSNFNTITSQSVSGNEILVDYGGVSGGFLLHLDLVVPDDAKFYAIYFTFDCIVDRGWDTTVGMTFELTNPQIYLQTTYYNAIINSIINSRPPSGSGSIGSVDDAEDSLKDSVSMGSDLADDIFNESSGLILAHVNAFFFLSNVFERMISVGWLRGVLVISLSLGLLGFIANFASFAGRSLEHKSKMGGSS